MKQQPSNSSTRSIIRRWTRILIALLGALIASPFAADLHQVLDLLSNFQFQYLCAACVLCVAALLIRDRVSIIAAIICLIATGVMIAPWYLPWPSSQSAESRDVRLMLFNVLQSSTSYEQVIAHVQSIDPDVIVMQEVNGRWMEQLMPLADRLPHYFHAPGGKPRGMAIFSKSPFVELHTETFDNPDSPSISVKLHIKGQQVAVLATHPWPPVSAALYASRNDQLQKAAAHIAQQQRPAILIGDLNTAMWSPHYRRFEARSTLRNVRRGFGVLPSYPMDAYALLRVPIDHCLVSNDFEVLDCRLGEPCGSDHAPLIVDLRLRAQSIADS